RMIVYSAIGIVMFFVPVTINGASSIPLDHLVTWVRGLLGPADRWVGLAIIDAGAVYPFASGRWRTSTTRTVFALLAVLGLVASAMVVFGVGPSWILDKSIGPFLMDKLVVPVGLIVPIGGVFLALVIGYGLMEFVGVYLRPAMRPIWRVPGRAAVDAVASFVGSYALGLLLTNRMYTGGRYTAREAAIIAAGFSTVSATFMVIVAKTLGLMDIWLWYFFGTLVVTFAVTAITVRIPPLSRIPDEVYPGAVHSPELAVTRDRFRVARRAAEQTLRSAGEAAAGLAPEAAREALERAETERAALDQAAKDLAADRRRLTAAEKTLAGADETAAALAAELAAGIGRVSQGAAPEPGLWEVDANLRPEGKDGALSRTVESHAEYYRRWAHGWEFQALLKARPIAGSPQLGE
ncbi:nucleoside recognition domain-containing protein, partial [Mesorhizobium sp. B2-6-6]|uniref:YjiH family protein n=1 Tax=Mesorhizobium sp. B2-6-6 TaxID=2589911 RepID=UPI0032428A86